MKLFRPLIFLFIIIGSSAFQMEQDDFHPILDVNSFIEKIDLYAVETNTIKSNFKQEKHLTMLEEVLVSEGHFIFQKENNVLWEYNKPVDYAIIVFEGQFTIRDGDKVNAFNIESNRMFREINNMIITSVSGNFLDNPDFKSAYFENNAYYLVKLSPLKQEVKNMLSTIEIYFNKNDISVSKVKFIEPGDDFTLIQFSETVFNEPVSEQVFKIEAAN
jgi:outer membrane lipoprotein-sorting protein